MSNRTVVMGVDLSFTGLGLIAEPEDWDLDWRRVLRKTIERPLKSGSPPWEQKDRLVSLTEEAVDFAQRHDVTHAWIEALPTHGGKFYSAGMLEQLGGAIRYALWRDCRIVANTAVLQEARYLIIGTMALKDSKKKTATVVRSFAGFPADATADEIDAWVAANYGMSLLGGCTVAAEAA